MQTVTYHKTKPFSGTETEFENGNGKGKWRLIDTVRQASIKYRKRYGFRLRCNGFLSFNRGFKVYVES
jgi:hypothetical protein